MSAPQDKKLDEAAVKAANHLYSLSDDCPAELRQGIGQLRQLINEEFVHKGNTVGSQTIWDMLKPYAEAWHQSELVKARLDENRIMWNLPKDKGLVYFEEHVQKRFRKLDQQLNQDKESIYDSDN